MKFATKVFFSLFLSLSLIFSLFNNTALAENVEKSNVDEFVSQDVINIKDVTDIEKNDNIKILSAEEYYKTASLSSDKMSVDLRSRGNIEITKTQAGSLGIHLEDLVDIGYSVSGNYYYRKTIGFGHRESVSL